MITFCVTFGFACIFMNMDGGMQTEEKNFLIQQLFLDKLSRKMMT